MGSRVVSQANLSGQRKLMRSIAFIRQLLLEYQTRSFLDIHDVRMPVKLGSMAEQTEKYSPESSGSVSQCHVSPTTIRSAVAVTCDIVIEVVGVFLSLPC